jgi:hypothetical protein
VSTTELPHIIITLRSTHGVANTDSGYSQGQFTESLSNLCARKAKQEAHKTARKKRDIAKR